MDEVTERPDPRVVRLDELDPVMRDIVGAILRARANIAADAAANDDQDPPDA